MPQSDADASEFGHCRERRTELVIAGGDTPEVFEFVEEALDKITLFVKPWREADRTFAQRLWRDIGPPAALRDVIPEPVGIISLVA